MTQYESTHCHRLICEDFLPPSTDAQAKGCACLMEMTEGATVVYVILEVGTATSLICSNSDLAIAGIVYFYQQAA